MRKRGLIGLGLAAIVCACADGARDASPERTDSVAAATPDVPLVPLDSGAPKLLPFDSADYSFVEFRRRLLHALQQRDTLFLYSILAPDIKNSFGGDDSIAGFKRIWQLSEPNSRVWSVLTRVLNLGGRHAGETFIAPYVYAAWPDSIDAFEHVAVTSANATGRAAPAPDALAEGTLSYSIVRVDERHGVGDLEVAAEDSWARVRGPGGRSSWINGADYYSPVGWRAFFEKRAGRWVMTILVAGD